MLAHATCMYLGADCYGCLAVSNLRKRCLQWFVRLFKGYLMTEKPPQHVAKSQQTPEGLTTALTSL